jgi:hypothetical protein
MIEETELTNIKPTGSATRECRERVLKVMEKLYYTNLFLSLAAAIALLILEPKLREAVTLTLALVIMYGFMLVWLVLLNILFVVRCLSLSC